MKESIKSIIYIIFGIAICVAGFVTDATTEIICLGGAVTLMAIVSLVVNIIDEKKIKKHMTTEEKHDETSDSN